jgi:hypothetical protein
MTLRGVYLQLCMCEGSMWRANPEDIDQTAGDESLDALVLMAEQGLRNELLCNLVQRIAIRSFLVQVLELFGEATEAAVELPCLDGFASTPR